MDQDAVHTEVSLVPGHIIRWGPPKGTQQPPIFDPCRLWPNGY